MAMLPWARSHLRAGTLKTYGMPGRLCGLLLKHVFIVHVSDA
jgi:hypothetical protein